MPTDLEIISAQLSRIEAKIDALEGGPSDSLLSVESAAKFLDTTPLAIRGLQKRGELPYKKRGRRILYLKSEIEKLLVNYPAAGSIDALRSDRKRF